MVHPTELLRTDSTGDEGSFVAPVGDYRNDVDCGCNLLPCLSEKLNLERFAKPGYFVGVLSLAGLFAGIVVKYFRGTSRIWSIHYDIPQDTIDWLIYVNEVFVGIFALFVAYWGNRMHRPNWLGALTMYFGISCITLAIPEIYQPLSQSETDINAVNGRILCQASRAQDVRDLSFNINNQKVAFAILILFQVVFALYTISFLTHGITYIDDNTSPTQSPAMIALIFAAQRLGKQVGIYSAWLPFIITNQSIFITIIWLVVAAHILIFGCLVAMFPKIMPRTLLRKSVNSLLSIAYGDVVIEHKRSVDGFFKSVWRVLKNKVLLLNITSMMLMQAAIINFNIKEKFFNQSKYHVSKYNDVSGYSDPALIQFSTNLLKQPLIAVSYITIGLVIAKMKPKAKYLVLWNIKVFGVIFLSFASLRFLSCTSKIRNELDGRFTIPYCSWDCGCSLDGPFQPVCLNGETHFSPCWAGCSSFDTSLRMYGNCSCGSQGTPTAAEGSCDANKCSTLWALVQAHGVVSAALLGTTFITTLVINLRCVNRKDKALALGLHMTFSSLFPYLPIRAVYDLITDNFCQIWGRKSCQFYSDDFTLYISIISLILKLLAIAVAVALLFFIDKIELYKSNHSRRDSDEDLTILRRPAIISSNSNDTNLHNNSTNNNNNIYNNNEGGDDEHIDLEEPQESNVFIHNPNDIVVRNKQKSESKLDTMLDRPSKDDRINAYLSEGDLVPPLNSNLKLGKSPSKNSNSIVSTDSSLSALANTVGDDHDSDFSSLQRPQRVKVLEKELENIPENRSSPKSDSSHTSKPTPRKWSKENLQETEL